MKFLNKKLMTVFSIVYNIAEVHQFPRNSVMEFQNICNEMVARFLRHPVYLLENSACCKRIHTIFL